MAIRTSEVVFFAVVRGGSIVALQENNPVNIAAVGSGGWTRVSAQASGGAILTSSFLVTGADNSGTVEIATGNVALDAAFAAGEDVTLTLTIGASTETITFHLRTVRTLDYLLLQNGSHTPVAVNAGPPAGYLPYAWAGTAGSGLGAATLTFTPGAPPSSQVLSVASPPSWNLDGANFSLTISTTHSSNSFLNSTSSFGAVPGPSTPTLALRALEKSAGVPLTGYTYLRGHVTDSTATGLNAQAPAGTTVSGTLTGAPGDWPTAIPFDPLLLPKGVLGGVAEGGIVTWTANATLQVSLTDSNNIRPTAFVTGLTFRIRELTGASLAVAYDVVAGSQAVAVSGADAYTFDALSVSGGTSVFATTLAPPRVQWGQFALRAGDTDTLSATVHPSLDAGCPRESCGRTLNVATPAMSTIGVTPPTLPTARQRVRYQATITATGVTVTAGSNHLEWYLEPADTTDLEVGAASTTVVGNVLRTQALHVIPSAWAAGNRPIHVHVVLRDDTTGVVLATSDAPAPPTLQLPIVATKSNVNAVLMIDRSGSMNDQNRWTGAMSGALNFAQLVHDQNVNLAKQHGVQAMWFGGWDDVPAPNYPSPVPAHDPLGAGDYGTLKGDGGAGVIDLDLAHFAGDASFLAALAEAATRQTPYFWTAIGSGLLAAKDVLLAADPAYTKERVVFCFTDGMENRVPFVADATKFDSAGGTFWEHPDPALALPSGDPLTRIYACALGTAQSFADQLKPACDNTGGIGALDVKFIPAGTTTSGIASLVQNWFSSSFAMLFGLTSLTSPDPELAGGTTAAHVVAVTEGHSQLVLCLFANAPSSSDWTFDLQPPGGTTVITEAQAAAGALGPGVRVFAGPLHKTLVVDLPLAVPGEGQRWAGEWTFHVTRLAQTTGDYLFAAMAKQDITFQVALDAPAPVRVGNHVLVRAYLSRGDNVIDDARVVAHVTSPGKWLDDTVARRAGRALGLPHAGAAHEAGRAPVSDMTDVQRVAREVVGSADVHHRTFDVVLQSIGHGFYQGSFVADEPGTWDVRTTVDGSRRGPRDWARWERTSAEMTELLPPRALERERVRLGREAAVAQSFHLEDDQTLGVLFVPDAQHSVGGGALRRDGLDLFVVPEDARGNLLGIGRANDIVFHTDCGGFSWPSVDLGNGTYAAHIPIAGRDLRVVRGVLLGEGIVLGDRKHALPVCNGRFDLGRFSARVLGVEVPVPVRAPMGKLTRADLELAFPSVGTALGAAAVTLAHVEKEDPAKLAAAATGLAPLFATLRRAVDVDFARTAGAVAARRYGLEVAKRALCDFCRVNGHEGALGRLAGQLEALTEVTLDAWPAAHVKSADHCRDGFFDDADELRGLVRRVIAHVGVHAREKK